MDSKENVIEVKDICINKLIYEAIERIYGCKEISKVKEG